MRKSLRAVIRSGSASVRLVRDWQLTAGDQTSTVGPGTVVFIPRNVVHRFKNVGDKTACMLDWSLPGGQDRYFKAVSELAAGGAFAGEKVRAISKRFDTNYPVAH